MTIADLWDQRISAFLLSPSQFLATTTTESFLADLLHELRNDKANDQLKILLVSVLLEHPTLLCPSVSVGEETALELLSVFSHTPQKSIVLKCNVILAITSVIICTSCLATHSKTAEDWLDLLFQTVQDTNDYRCGLSQQPIRATACDCLREMEACNPGLLSQKLEALYLLKQQETTVLHQSYCLLYTLGLKNAIRILANQKDVTDLEFKSILGGNEGFAWKCNQVAMTSLPVNLLVQVPRLPQGLDCKELKSIMSSLLEESYLLTPISQSALLRELVEVVAMVPGLSPTLFKSQLLRLFGTADVSLMHATLFMKDMFTDSLFTPEDENFLLKRLVGTAQHPLLRIPEKLFYMECILHFPENRPISSSGEESLPVLVTPRLAASLHPTVFNDSATMLCRLNLLCLVHLEADEGEADKGIGYLFDHIMALLKIVDNDGSREVVVTSFRALFIFLMHFNGMGELSEKLINKLCDMYSKHSQLAPNLIGLADRIQEHLDDPVWSVKLLRGLQKCIMELPPLQLTIHNLSWHLKVLKRVAKEGQITQRNTIYLLLNVLINSNLCERGNWQVGNAVLAVCRNLLKHPSIDQVFIELADLLQYISIHYDDTDIKDHARFYYTLLTNLSWEKLTGVLAKGLDGGRAKERSHSAIMAESEGIASNLTVHKTNRHVLQLIKVQEKASQSSSGTMEATGEDQNWLEVYQGQFQTPGFGSEVTLRYNLTHAKDTDPLFDKVFTICLHFELNDLNYAKVSDIHVPCVFRDRKPPEVKVKLKPFQPYPTSLSVSAVFTTQDGHSWHSRLPDVSVSFPEIFLPLPLPPNSSCECKEQVFEYTWEAAASGNPDKSAISLFCFKPEDESLADLIKTHFQGYLITDQQSKRSWKVLFFLPPKYHILLKITQAEDAARVNIATDNWELLPFVNSYLQNITDKCSTTETDG
ncbi:AP-5 complex subunit beta-1 [Puntigrus tetrazona]|uniref:AP-5 complex subunit beta-1 n=1 Tax=Puntigrus tetrazona TaxID=1606681 RepID=UPI001C89C96B|nr:AP-5 complex subunit beta-1 [Puntigrus tetrazona]XP_043108849.1 AP-5 complex subunit beta-1 [Puntigrus tetrazona]XP_043108850.1 AP-5 complex subunit beta-1 [Puntigrus tetrazona]XP_043108851.1 AP-5 complex subunit beta-1 [Puntigrus tetrazona]XP_043108852.1 AP-5 complex subunit beta-1 [Puntigrus tetrazona]